MLNKLALRNAKRSARDYLIYILTMVLITALMFAFHSMIFSKSVQELCSEAGIMAIMIGLSTFFIVLIVVWLVHYMVKFMAEKRSREFATYLLIGFRKKQIAKLFLKETMLLGLLSFLIGLLPGIFLQQVMISIIYAIVGAEYSLRLEINAGTLFMTAGVYLLAYVLAVFRNKRRFRKMNIHDMMYAERENEKLGNGNRTGKRWMLAASVCYMVLFAAILYTGRISVENILFLILGLILAVYFFYAGLSAFLVSYIRKGKGGIWNNGTIFVLRQLSSKIRTMQFTLGTLTILFMTSLLGFSMALMLNYFQDTKAVEQWPFDVAVYSEDVSCDFKEELALIRESEQVKEELLYHIYEGHTNEMNRFLAENSRGGGAECYYLYDTYIRLSDYNRLRQMLGYGTVRLEEGQYLIHIADRLLNLGEQFAKRQLAIGDVRMSCAGVYAEPFEQTGHNGADYLLVVPDETAERLKPFYSLLMVQLETEADRDLQKKLTAGSGKAGEKEELEIYLDLPYDVPDSMAFGTNNIYVTAGSVHVRSIEIRDMKFMLSAITFPLFYIGLVFICVALTILSVQQLSDSNKFKYRYGILRKLGMREKEIQRVVLKQLSAYYLCPFMAALLLSAGIVLYLSSQFNFYSGVPIPSASYIAMSAGLTAAVYLIYFTATYVEFSRNIAK